MKALFALFAALTFSLTFANSNRVGDQIVLSGSFSGIKVVTTSTYTEFRNGQMTQEDVTRQGRSVHQSTSQLSASDIMTKQKAASIVAYCSQIGGTHEYLNLPVGKTLTCKMNSQALAQSYDYNLQKLSDLGEAIWLGPFPVLGVAQIETAGIIMKVNDYTWAN